MTLLERPFLVWTIAGSDSSGGAGIQADLHTFRSFDVHGCSVITAITAQNSSGIHHIEYTSPESLLNQLQSLNFDLPAKVIKLGMLGTGESLAIIADFLSTFSGVVILDPVMSGSKGGTLLKKQDLDFFKKHILPQVDILTPNISEALILSNESLSLIELERIPLIAQRLLDYGVKTVIIKGGHLSDSNLSQDYYYSADQAFWLSSVRRIGQDFHGSGCILSSALAALMARGYEANEAFVIAKMYLNQGIRLSKKLSDYFILGHGGWPSHSEDLPWLSNKPYWVDLLKREQELMIRRENLGLYPIVDSFEWVEKLIQMGVKSIQLRIKEKAVADLTVEIEKSVRLAQDHQVKLYINDYWKIAIKVRAYGVHLGQEDLQTADIKAIKKARLSLGISAHNLQELASAHALNPSYIAFGPIYDSPSKKLKYLPQGLADLKYWRKIVPYSLIAIGGITLQNCDELLEIGVDGLALISALYSANNLLETVQAFQAKFAFVHDKNSDS